MSAERTPRIRLSATARSVLLGVSMGVANALGYLFVLVLARPLGPAEFGGFAAVNAYGVLLAIPAGALQYSVARHQGPGAEPTSGTRVALTIGAVLTLGTAAAALPLAHLMHTSSPWPVVLMGAMLLPMTLIGALQGILLGGHRLVALSAVYLVIAVTRLAAAAIAVALHLSVAAIFGATLIASIVSLAAAAWLCRHELRELPTHAGGMLASTLRSNSTMAALTALTSVDVLLARHVLPAGQSGGYALAATFGKAVFWGTQFVAMSVLPRTQGLDAPHVARRGVRVVAALGLLGALVAAAAPGTWMAVLGGEGFRAWGWLAVLFSLVGTLWGCTQVLLVAEIGRDQSRLGALAWAMTGVEALLVLVWWRDSESAILGAAALAAGTVMLAGLVHLWRASARVSPRPGAPSSARS